MDIGKEKEIIYQLMRSVIEERRELSKQYLDLKSRLDNLNKNISTTVIQENELKKMEAVLPSMKKRNEFFTQRKSKKEPIERVAGYVSEILRSSEVPISSKAIYEQLVSNYDINIQYINFRNNILPKLEDFKQYSIEKAYRGYWQYRRESLK
ncbi:hypothetical protein [Enterococcus sp. AZ007]|uniref:hypothetical protein n=1 Tax=Enterococcus sp. AZ007 TaxID=2774839 RepID=UPI003F2272D1